MLLAFVPAAGATSIDFVIPGGVSDFGTADNLVSAAAMFFEPLFGSGLDVGSTIGNGTPSNDGVGVNCRDCELSFQTGGLFAVDAATASYGPGRVFGVTGHVDLNGNNLVDAGEPNGPLLVGQFAADTTVINKVLLGDVGFFSVSTIIESINPFLTGFYGMPVTAYTGEMTLNFTNANPLPAGFLFFSDAVQASIVVNSVVPVPGTLFLFGAGLLAAIGIWRRELSSPTSRSS